MYTEEGGPRFCGGSIFAYQCQGERLLMSHADKPRFVSVRADAELFQAHFGGEFVDPKDRPKL